MRIKKALAVSEFEKKNYKKAMETYAKLNISPMEVSQRRFMLTNEVISLYPFLMADAQIVPARPPPDPADRDDAVSALVEYLTQVFISSNPYFVAAH